MNKHMGWLAKTLLLGASVVGCADSTKDPSNETVETGTLAMPLVSNGPSGVAYRLRNATFTISPYGYYYGVAGGSSAGAAGAPSTTTVSSETEPNADTIEVELESGYYNVSMASGWSMVKIEGGVEVPVEAQLLSAQTQWINVARHSTNWVRYQFGIGDHALWFNGQLNLDMQVYEDPSQYYGGVAGNRAY